MNQDTKWLIFGLVLVVALVFMFTVLAYIATTNNTERDRIRTEAGLIGPYQGNCTVNSVGYEMVLSCSFELDPDDPD